jgi:hypothetical protein
MIIFWVLTAMLALIATFPAPPLQYAFERALAIHLMTNMSIYHQSAVTWVQTNGGAAFNGVVTRNAPLTAAGPGLTVPSSYTEMETWQSRALAGVIITCPSAALTKTTAGDALAGLKSISEDDPGAGYIVAGPLFRSINVTAANAINAFVIPAGCPVGWPAYVSRVN